MDAPFGKVVVALRPEAEEGPSYNGKAVSALGVCEVYVSVSPDELVRFAGDYQWLSSRVGFALKGIEASLLWSSLELVRRVEEVGGAEPVCDYELSRLRKVDRRSGVICVTRFVATKEWTKVVVSFFKGDVALSSVEVRSSEKPFALEDEFPIRHAKIHEGRYILMDGSRKILAAALLPSAAPPSEATP